MGLHCNNHVMVFVIEFECLDPGFYVQSKFACFCCVWSVEQKFCMCKAERLEVCRWFLQVCEGAHEILLFLTKVTITFLSLKCWLLQKQRPPQKIASLKWILKVTDLATVVSLAASTRSVPLGKWGQWCGGPWAREQGPWSPLYQLLWLRPSSCFTCLLSHVQHAQQASEGCAGSKPGQAIHLLACTLWI